ncbi:MAG: TonB-dependent receptor [Melioribacteraceae bacterium]|nr:hypothetical protein [Ignavibacteriota bacterium]MBZ0182576.1 TonB-dependent receptor [Melioribacteraceae bacterium]
MRKLTLIILTILFSSILYAQNGKLVGVVKDKQTNEPLIGANVIINGTNYGAATDIDGKFIILNIPPGRYNVTASMVGYGKVTQTDVTLFIDRTTNIEFTLTDETIEIGQVTVTAAKPAVVKDRTSTATNIEAEQIKAAPIEGLRGTLDLSAGFQKNATGNYSVRGSGSYEVSFQINGLVQSNSNTSAPGSFDTEKADNSWKYDVNPLGVQQVQLITGGFSAEYGNAQAGVVNVVLKEGGPKFNGEFRVEYRPPGQYHYGDYIYSKNNYEWQKWGELADWMARRDDIIKELKLDVRYAGIKNSNPQLYDELVNREIAWAHSVWVENHEPSDDNVLGVYDYTQYAYTRYLFGFGGPLGKDPNFLKFYLSGEYKRNPTRLPTPEKVQELQNYILNVTYNPIKDHKIRLMGSYQSYTGGIWSGSDDIRWSGLAFTPPGVSTKYLVTVDPVREEQTIAQSLEWVYTINNNSFFQLNLSHQQEQYEIPFKYLAGYGLEVDRVDSSSDPTGTVLREGSWWEKDFFRAPFGFSTNYYQDSRTENFGIKGDYTNQISNTHLVKAGFQFYYWDLFNNGVNSSFQANSYVARNGFADFYQAYPINYSFYIQDKMEYEGMIANVGMRVEAYNFQTGVPLDRFNILYPGTEGPGTLGSPLTENSEWKYILLPRLGISFPIGESTAFRFQYGHFASMPIFSQALSKKTWVGWQGLGNPNLDPKKTINYEFGLQQQVDDNHRLDMVLYYNDRTTQIGRQNIASFTGSRNQFAGFASDNSPLYYYWSFANNSFGSTVGLELTFETIRIQNWSYRFSYSLSQTTSGNYGASIVYPDDTRGYSTRDYTGEFLAPWDRTHNFRALVQYFFREDEGFSIFGVNPLENLIVSMTYTAQSGTPFTYVTDFTLRDVVYNRRYPIESSVDLNVTKEIMLSDIKLILGLRVMNLFDNKWITPMSTSDDVRLWVEDGITIADAGVAERGDPSRLSYITAPYRIYRNIPRQIFFTLGIGF